MPETVYRKAKFVWIFELMAASELEPGQTVFCSASENLSEANVAAAAQNERFNIRSSSSSSVSHNDIYRPARKDGGAFAQAPELRALVLSILPAVAR